MSSIVKHVAALFGCLLLASTSQAQYGGGAGGYGGGGGGYNRPAVSPYLNLNRTGDPAINYYGLVRPQFQYNRAIQNFGNDINFLESNFAANQQQLPLQTGQGAGFMTQGQYFMNNGSRVGGIRPGGSAGTAGTGGGQVSSPRGR